MHTGGNSPVQEIKITAVNQEVRSTTFKGSFSMYETVSFHMFINSQRRSHSTEGSRKGEAGILLNILKKGLLKGTTQGLLKDNKKDAVKENLNNKGGSIF